MCLLCVGNVHIACSFLLTDLTTFFQATLCSVGFGNVDEKGQRCGCYERCFFLSADVADAAVLLLLCCCSCATRIVCVSDLLSQVVQFHLGVGSSACILPQKSTVLLRCGRTCSSPLKKTQALGWNFEVYMPNKMKGKSSRRHRCCLCYCCRFTALLCYAAVVALLSSFEFALCSDCADSPQLYMW